MTSRSSNFSGWQLRTLVIGLVAAVGSIIGAFFDPAQFFHSYLFVWLFWAGLSLGALAVVMLQSLTGGLWGLAIRNFCQATFVTLPLMALLFLPVPFGAHWIYSWSNYLPGSLGYHHKQQYLSLPFFTARSFLYLGGMIFLAFLLRKRLFRLHSQTASHSHTAGLSAGGLIAYVLSMNFASTDWVMSLDPEWFSTIFAIVFMTGQFLAALALMTALLAAFAPSMERPPPKKVFHDLGNMLLAFVVFWTYVSFSQFLIIWSGNLPKEISWYLSRRGGGWQWFALGLALTQFLLPFALLLSRAKKRDPRTLALICVCIIAANVGVNFWFVAPTFHPGRIYLHWLDPVEFLALGGFWFALFFRSLKQRPLLPPQLEALSHA